MERYYHVWKNDCDRIVNEANDWIAKYNALASRKGMLEIERFLGVTTSTETLMAIAGDLVKCFDDWDKNTPIDLSVPKTVRTGIEAMVKKANNLNLACVAEAVDYLQNILILINELLVYREVYQSTLFHISENNLLNLELNNKDLYEAFCDMPCKRVSIETEVEIGSTKYLVLCTMQPTYKNEPEIENGALKGKPAYYRFATDLYNKKTGLFEHLSHFYLKKNSDKVWMRHCTDKLHEELDNATIFCNGYKENVQLGCFSDLTKTKFEISKNDIAKKLETPTDTLSCALIGQLIMATVDYDRITSEPETVVQVQSKRMTKKHQPSVVSKKVEVLEQDRYIPMSSLHRVRKLYEKKEWQGGHHNSPIPHDVSGHWRVYKNGKKIWVNPYHKECKGYQEVHKIIEIGK